VPKRELSLLDAVSIRLGSVVGAGIFYVIGPSMKIGQGWILPAFLVAAVVSALTALSTHEVAQASEDAGPSRRDLIFVAASLLAASVVAKAVGRSTSIVLTGLDPAFAAGLSIALATGLNVVMGQRTDRKMGQIHLAILGLALVALLFLTARCIPRWSAEHVPFPTITPRDFLATSALAVFALTGFAQISSLGPAIKNPSAMIPRAMVITIVASAVLFAVVTAGVIGSVGIEALTQSNRPLETAASSLEGESLRSVVGISAILAMTGLMVGHIGAAGRIVAALWRRRDSASITVTTVVAGVSVLALAALVRLFPAVVISAALVLIYWAMVHVAAIRLDRSRKRYPIVVAIAGIVCCLTLAVAVAI
jgi:APA family basic amino acid/polyamine antiporter